MRVGEEANIFNWVDALRRDALLILDLCRLRQLAVDLIIFSCFHVNGLLLSRTFCLLLCGLVSASFEGSLATKVLGCLASTSDWSNAEELNWPSVRILVSMQAS